MVEATPTLMGVYSSFAGGKSDHVTRVCLLGLSVDARPATAGRSPSGVGVPAGRFAAYDLGGDAAADSRSINRAKARTADMVDKARTAMDLELLVRGLIIGFAIAAPVGPIGLLCIQRTLAHGRLTGLATGMGAASADAVYGMVAGFGLTAISAFLTGQRLWLGIIGGLFLCYLGVRTFLTPPAMQSAAVTGPVGVGRICQHLCADVDQPDDDLLVYGGICRVGAGGCAGRGTAGGRRWCSACFGVGVVVAVAQRRRVDLPAARSSPACWAG